MTSEMYAEALPDIPSPPHPLAYVEGITGLRVHVRRPGLSHAGGPAVCYSTVFPNWPFSWRNVMPVRRNAGTTYLHRISAAMARPPAGDGDYDGDSHSFTAASLCATRSGVSAVRLPGSADWSDMISAAGVAALCALVRPYVFRSSR